MLLIFSVQEKSYGQMFNFKTSEASEMLKGDDIEAHGFPDTITVYCNEWSGVTSSPSTWFSQHKLKSNSDFVKFSVDHEALAAYQKTINYTYRLTYQMQGINNPFDTTTYSTASSDTLTISYNNLPNNTPYQDLHLKKYTGFYKTRIILTGLYTDTGGVINSAILTDVGMRNFQIEGSIVTQDYDKTLYGSGVPALKTSAFNTGNNLLNIYWDVSADTNLLTATPINYELEWTYIDDYANPVDGGASPLTTYDFLHNSTRVWVNTNHYAIPLTYPDGYVAFRVRVVRPDSVLYEYPVYGTWSAADNGNISSLSISSGTGAFNTSCYKITAPYMGDSLNWQYTVSFAEDGKYKHVGTFYDGLLKNRQSITRFNSDPDRLIATNNVYDYEGRPCIKTLPAPTPSSGFAYLHNVDLNSLTNKPYQASDFDSGVTATCPTNTVISSLSNNALANIYYSHANPDTAGVQQFVPDAQGYPLVQTIYEPAFTERVEEQGGAGLQLQIGNGNTIRNSYVGANQEELNALFGANVGWGSYYKMTVSQDPNQQLSMSIKDYQGKLMASSMIGTGPAPGTHAIKTLNVPSPTYYKEDLLSPFAPGQLIDSNAATKVMDEDYFNQVQANDSLQYHLTYSSYLVCASNHRIAVKGHYNYIITDQCGDTATHQEGVLGFNGPAGDTTITYAGAPVGFFAAAAPYHVHKELSFYPSDINEAVDSFFQAPPSCFLTQNNFIRGSVDTTVFPCPPSIDGDSSDADPCAKKKLQMLQQLYPGAVYAQYFSFGGNITSTGNSVFSKIDCYGTDTTVHSFIYIPPHNCHYRYQDTCLVSLPDSITVGGITYHDLITMPIDSFIMVYNGSLAEGNTTIAEALLPLHPQYCELENCFNDTFKTQVLAIPDAGVAESLGLLYLDSLVAHDPLRALMTATGHFPNPTDSLLTYSGGTMRLDTMIFINAYCACSDSSMFNDCYSRLFKYDISHHLLINSQVKKNYFTNMVNLYFSNRQKYVDAVLTNGGNSCSHCAMVRMDLDPSAALPPDVVSVTTGSDSAFAGNDPGWIANYNGDTTGLFDSATNYFNTANAALCSGVVDSVIAALSNCTVGNTTLINNVRSTFDSLCTANAFPFGNMTPDQVLYVLKRNNITLNDICNPYILNYYNYGTPPAVPVNSCMPDAFYTGINSFLNTTNVLNALKSPGTAYAVTLSTSGNQFESNVSSALGGITSVNVKAAFSSASKLYQLFVTSTIPGDTVKISLHAPNCGSTNFFATSGAVFSITTACSNSDASLETGTGLINQYSFIANVSANSSGVITNCQMTGWADSIQTMLYNNSDIAQCVPCTQMRSLYTRFNDTLTHYHIYGADHPYYAQMLASFMNYNMQRNYTADQYLTFIQSCALGDSISIPLYVGYATFTFNSDNQMNNFFSGLDAVDPLYDFDNTAYRDSSASAIRVSVNLNSVPQRELWKYVNFLNGYSSSGYVAKYINTLLGSIPPENTGELGFLYTDPAFPFYPPDSTALSAITTGSTYNTSTRYVWQGGHFVKQTFYDIIAPAIPYKISTAVAGLSSYIINQGIPGAVFVPNYQHTVNADYYKPQKQAYLQYVYKFQPLSPYEVLDSIGAPYLMSNIPTWSGYDVSYSLPTNASAPSNLYISTGATNRYLDTLQKIINLAGASGFIFHSNPSYAAYSSGPASLVDYVCSDGAYWYRYFTTGDTLFNAYVAFPKYIPTYMRPSYKVVKVSAVPGDSLNRHFALSIVRPPTSDTITLYGLTSFSIGKDIELDNVLLGQPLDGTATISIDTINNCERQTLYSAISMGIVAYNNYIDSSKVAVAAALKKHLVDSSKESLFLNYMTDEFNYTLYNYDRAGNLAFTVTPAGNTPIASANQLYKVDTSRANNTPSSSPEPTYTKINKYNYNSVNQVIEQNTVDGGQTRFFYDAAGRLIFSQNARQAPAGNYTYNIYDQQSRLIETGQAQIGWPYFDPYSVAAGSSGPFPAHYYYYLYTATEIVSGHPVYHSNWLISPDPSFVENLTGLSADSVAADIHSYTRSDVVMTIYDTAATKLNTIAGLDSLQNLRHRVSCVKFFPVLSSADHSLSTYSYATHYSYDIDGNVKTLVQDFPELKSVKQRYKRIDYDYDLISGKVNMLSYNRGWPDQFYQRYTYDADNRITAVQTSEDGYIWKQDAAYTYYEHGPLARIQLGDLRVQGIDYAYTIQGWLKAVNGDTLKTSMDMGLDGTMQNITAKDAVDYTIDYFKNDYKPITNWQMQHVPADSLSLYNGNISRQTVAINTFQRLNKQYMYDQLNRINTAAYASVNSVNNTLNGLTDFKSNYNYDPDGNLTALVRYGNNTGTGAKLMDSLIYGYGAALQPDALMGLADYSPNNYTNDLQHYASTAQRYTYDAIGNMIKDEVSGQDTIMWNLYDKVTETRSAMAGNNLQFEYDGAGNRVAKHVITATSGGAVHKNDYYVRDAQGNILAVYNGTDIYSIATAHNWASDINGALRSEVGVTVLNNNFIIPNYATNGYFQQSLISQSLGNSPFVTSQLNHPVGYFMQNSSAVYQNMLLGSTGYIVPLQQYGKQVHDSVIGKAYNQTFQTGQQGLAQQLLVSLFQNPNIAQKQYLLSLMCQTGDNNLMIRLSNELGMQFSNCEQMPAQLVPALDNNMGNLYGFFKPLQQQFPIQFSRYMNLLGSTDSIFHNPYYMSGQSAFQLNTQNILSISTLHPDIINFFNQYSGATQELYQQNSNSSLLQIVYNSSPSTYVTAANTTLGDNAIDAAIFSIPNLSFHDYLVSSEMATGATLSISTASLFNEVHTDFNLAEHDIYGSSRIGVKTYNPTQIAAIYDDASNPDTVRLYNKVPWYSLDYQDDISTDSTNPYGNTLKGSFYAQHTLGQKQYELADHLGNVLATISDKRSADSLMAADVTHTLTLDSPASVLTWKPVVVSAHDYYPFGEYMPGRYTTDTSTTCLLSTVTEMVPSVYYTLPDFNSLLNAGDLHAISSATLSSGNGGVVVSSGSVGSGFSYDITTLPPGASGTLNLTVINQSGQYLAQVTDDVSGVLLGSTNLTQGESYQIPFSASSGSATFRLTLASPSTGSITVGTLEIPHDTLISQSIVINTCNNDFYRFGFNGQEKVNEWAGLGNHNTALFWEYSTQTGKRLNLDLKTSPALSPYSVFGGSPIWHNDPFGDTVIIKGSDEFKNKTFIQLQRLTNDKLKMGKDGVVVIESSGTANLNHQYKTGTKLINDLVGNKSNNEIVETKDGETTDQIIGTQKDGKSYGYGIVHHNPDNTTGGKDVEGNKERPAFIGLAHELLHMKHVDELKIEGGSTDVPDPDDPGHTLTKEEYKTRLEENDIREEHKWPDRIKK